MAERSWNSSIMSLDFTVACISLCSKVDFDISRYVLYKLNQLFLTVKLLFYFTFSLKWHYNI